MNIMVLAGLLVAVFVAGMVFGRMSALAGDRKDRLLNEKVDAVLKHLGISFDPFKNIPVDVVSELQRGNKINAIKLYRQHSGVGLKAAKEVVDELEKLR